jgi:hypothetical protein
MAKTRRTQHGGSKLNGLIALVIVAVVVVGAIRIVPVYITAYAYRDFIRTKAKFADVERRPVEEVRKDVYDKARELELPVEMNQINIEKVPGGIRIQSAFSMPVDLVVMQRDFHFDFVADTRSTY